jgi:hypothetical protein
LSFNPHSCASNASALQVLNAILEPLKLGPLGELGDILDGLVNVEVAQVLQDKANEALSTIQDEIPLDTIKTVSALNQQNT